MIHLNIGDRIRCIKVINENEFTVGKEYEVVGGGIYQQVIFSNSGMHYIARHIFDNGTTDETGSMFELVEKNFISI